MRMISAAETVDALSIAEAAGIIADTYKALGNGEVEPSTPSAMRIAGPPHRIQLKGAILKRDGIAGARLSSRGHPRLMLWDLESGAPILFLEENWLYAFRTGVSGAVVARWLMPRTNPRIALIGAGAIATHMARAFVELCAPEMIFVAARTRESAERLARNVGQCVAVADSVEQAVRGADIVATITTASERIVNSDWIKPGARVLSMGGGPEFDVGIWHNAAHRFVDDLDYALYQGDLSSWVTDGALTAPEIKASVEGIGEVANGRWHGRKSANESVLAVIQGLTALDLALALAIY
ncbi:NAD(P)-binding domain-containing protein, partial [Pseudorhodoplanes sp.]|uniref:NAD(P)-binding domain-containing protein n=1 Tax=Pseudorhodoplanes sp. TaxID=1934341 RepID=UPI002B5E56D3